MSKYTLIQQLENPIVDERTPLPKGIEYCQKTLTVEGEERVANVPLRESKTFDELVSNAGSKITAREYNDILRKVRGIRG